MNPSFIRESESKTNKKYQWILFILPFCCILSFPWVALAIPWYPSHSILLQPYEQLLPVKVWIMPPAKKKRRYGEALILSASECDLI